MSGVGAVLVLLVASHVAAFTAGAVAEQKARRRVARVTETPAEDARGEQA